MRIRGFFAGLTVLCVAAFLATPVAGAPDGVVLQRVSGKLEYQSTAGENREPVTGQLLVQPRGFALTQAHSMAQVDLPDSSVVSIGASSRLGLGHFDRESWGSSSVMTIVDGAIHFSVKHPNGARANYRFITPTAQIAVRGTEGVIVARGDETVIACVHGSKNDIAVIYGANQKMYIPDGMTVHIYGRPGKHARMTMRPGIAGSEFDQFKSMIAHNHAMRMRGLEK